MELTTRHHAGTNTAALLGNLQASAREQLMPFRPELPVLPRSSIAAGEGCRTLLQKVHDVVQCKLWHRYQPQQEK